MNRFGNKPRATIDYESRSACSLRNSGTWRYSCDDTTQVLCLGFRLPHWPEGKTALWHPAFPHLGIKADVLGWDDESGAWQHLEELHDWIRAGKLVEAHNAWFERGITLNQLVAKYGWPYITPTQLVEAANARRASMAE